MWSRPPQTVGSLYFALLHAMEDVINQVALLHSRVATIKARQATLENAQHQFDRVDESLAAFFFLFVIRFRQAKSFRSVGTDERDIVPGEFRQRLWQLLQPAVVREAAVEDRRVGAEDEFV